MYVDGRIESGYLLRIISSVISVRLEKSVRLRLSSTGVVTDLSSPLTLIAPKLV